MDWLWGMRRNPWVSNLNTELEKTEPGSNLGRKANSCLGHAAFAASKWRPQAGSWEDRPDSQGRAEDWRCIFRTHHTWMVFQIMGMNKNVDRGKRGHTREPKGIPTFRSWWRRESAGNDPESSGGGLCEPLGGLHASLRNTFSQSFYCGEVGNDAT